MNYFLRTYLEVKFDCCESAGLSTSPGLEGYFQFTTISFKPLSTQVRITDRVSHETGR